jgi:hypothetical protein
VSKEVAGTIRKRAQHGLKAGRCLVPFLDSLEMRKLVPGWYQAAEEDIVKQKAKVVHLMM